jgi:pimeloyl-ACP methyl ester carboxylesterase
MNADDVPGFDPNDEFSLLAAEAAEFGIEVTSFPTVERVAFTASGGTALSALRWGVDEPEVVLLHGGGLNAHTWDATILALGVPALAIDLPGHGHSAWNDAGDYTPKTNAGPVGEAIAALAPNARLVAGQSLGGMTAIEIGGARPELIRRLALVDISPGLQIADVASVRDFLDGAIAFDSPDDIVDRAHAFGIGHSRAALQRGVWLNTRQRDDGKWVFRHHMTTLPAGAPFLMEFATLWPPLESLDVPVLLVHGTHGFLSPPVVAEFPTHVPGATIVAVDAGHNVQEDAPVELAQALADFLP